MNFEVTQYMSRLNGLIIQVKIRIFITRKSFIKKNIKYKITGYTNGRSSYFVLISFENGLLVFYILYKTQK